MRAKLFFALCLLTVSVQAQTVSFTGTKFKDASGVLVPTGTVHAAPVTMLGNPIGYQGGGGGQGSHKEVTCPIANGAVQGTCNLLDTSATLPPNLCLHIYATDPSGQPFIGVKTVIPGQPSGYDCVQTATAPASGTPAATWCASGVCNFDNYQPNLAPLALVQTGPAGPPNSLSIGIVTTGSPGSSATASITGAPPSQTLNLAIPQGANGAATVSLGTTSTGAPGTNASVTNTGSPTAAVLNFTFPQGAAGPPGSETLLYSYAYSAGSSATTLASYTLPANTVASGQGLKLKGFVFHNDTSNGMYTLSVNGTAVASCVITSDTGANWAFYFDVTIISQGAYGAEVISTSGCNTTFNNSLYPFGALPLTTALMSHQSPLFLGSAVFATGATPAFSVTNPGGVASHLYAYTVELIK